MSTMSKFHINAAGEAGPCKAENGGCPFGGEAEHYATAKEARDAYEAKNASGVLTRLRTNRFFKRAMVVGSMTVAAVSLAGCSSISVGYTETPSPTPSSSTSEEAAPEPNPTSSSTAAAEARQKLDEAYGKGKDWVDKNGPSIKDKAKKLWDEYSSGVDSAGTGSGPTSSAVDPANVYWQGKNLTPTPAEVAEAQATLNSLVVAPEGSSSAYDRSAQFGRGFETGVVGAVEHRDVPTAQFRNSTPQARVVDGHFTDPYTGEDVHVIGGKSYDADVDHLVPLKEVWDSGGSNWTEAQRVEYANNLDNLIYVGSGINRSKSDGDAAEFLPSYEPSLCRYAVAQIDVKGQYKLNVDSAEKSALQQVIDTRCTK